MYSHSISNAHFYSDQYEAAEELIKRTSNHAEIQLHLPKNSLSRAEAGDVTLIDEIVEDLKSQYKPLKAIKGIRAHQRN